MKLPCCPSDESCSMHLSMSKAFNTAGIILRVVWFDSGLGYAWLSFVCTAFGKGYILTSKKTVFD